MRYMRRTIKVLRIAEGTMARVVVVQVKCDRCRKVEHKTPDKNESTEPVFLGAFKGTTIEFQDLCSGCEEVVAMHWAEITKEMKKASPRLSNSQRAEAMAKVKKAGERKTDSQSASQRP